MSMVALAQQIASTYVVVCGVYGDVTRQAQERQISRQAIYRQSQRTPEDLEGAKLRATLAAPQERVGVLEAQAASLQKQLSQAVVLTPDLLRHFAATAAARRALLLACIVLLAKAGKAGEAMVRTVRSLFRTTWRASSPVEGINGVLRMHQARHRRLTQGLLDLKRLYWNSHRFRTGRRRSPYEHLGLRFPEGLTWWELLKKTPEQLREQLSALNRAA